MKRAAMPLSFARMEFGDIPSLTIIFPVSRINWDTVQPSLSLALEIR